MIRHEDWSNGMGCIESKRRPVGFRYSTSRSCPEAHWTHKVETIFGDGMPPEKHEALVPLIAYQPFAERHNGDTFADIAKRTIREVMAQRETILRAFVAETGLLPSQCEQVEQSFEGGARLWFVQRRRAINS